MTPLAWTAIYLVAGIALAEGARWANPTATRARHYAIIVAVWPALAPIAVWQALRHRRKA